MAHRRRAADAGAHPHGDLRRSDHRRALRLATGGWNGLLVVAALSIAACGGRVATHPGDESTGETTPVEDVFDPAQHRADDVRAEAEAVVRGIPAPPPDRGEEVIGATHAALDTSWIAVDGYRIQISVSTSRDQALSEAAKARVLFPDDSVYVIFQAPWHKVRIGDFRTRGEAEAKLSEAKGLGYASALWVTGRVRVMRRPEDASER